MLLEPEVIADFIAGDETVTAVYIDRDGRISPVVQSGA